MATISFSIRTTKPVVHHHAQITSNSMQGKLNVYAIVGNTRMDFASTVMIGLQNGTLLLANANALMELQFLL
jgi:hypothetical protein